MVRSGDLENNVVPGSTNAMQPGRQWTPWLVRAIVVANVAMFIMIMFVNNCPHNSHLQGSSNECVGKFLGRFSFQPLDENPNIGPSYSTLGKLGGLEWDKVVLEHQIWRLISCIWLDAGFFHLVVTITSLHYIGTLLEQQFGFVRVGVIYLLSGLGGSIFSAIFIQYSLSVGASGPLYGLLGAMLSELLTNWSIYSDKVAPVCAVIIFTFLNLFNCIGHPPMFFDYFANIGGFIAGFLLGFILLLRPQSGWIEKCHLPDNTRLKPKYTIYQYLLWVIAIVILVIGFVLGFVKLFRGAGYATIT